MRLRPGGVDLLAPLESELRSLLAELPGLARGLGLARMLVWLGVGRAGALLDPESGRGSLGAVFGGLRLLPAPRLSLPLLVPGIGALVPRPRARRPCAAKGRLGVPLL